MKMKAVLFGVVAAVTAGLVFFTGKAKASGPKPTPPPPDPPPGPPPPPPVAPPDGCVNGKMPGVSMSIATAQGALNKAGADPKLSTDGKYGPATKGALAHFQWASGLAQTGCLDGATAKALQPYVGGSSEPYNEVYKDSNKMPWVITKPGLSIWRAQQMPIDTTGNGDWQIPYPDSQEIFEAVTYDLLINRIETQVAEGYYT